MPRTLADLDWYSGVGAKQKLSPRCPIASAELCPRYFETFALLGDMGITTSIPKDRDASLQQKWQALQPIVREESPSVMKVGEELRSVSRFCPEVAYEIFGYFASGLYGYGDDIDREAAEKAYEREGIPARFDPAWATVTPKHFTEFREYSLCANFHADRSPLADVINLKPGLFGLSVDLKALWRWFQSRDSGNNRP